MQGGFSLEVLLDDLAERVAEKLHARLVRDATRKPTGPLLLAEAGQPGAPPTRMLKEREAAEKLGVSPQLLRKWRRDGAGPQFVKLNKCVRYQIGEIGRFVRLRRSRESSQKMPAGGGVVQ